MKKVIKDNDLDNIHGGTKSPPLVANVGENIEILNPHSLEELPAANNAFNAQSNIADITLNSAFITPNACKVSPSASKRPTRRRIDE